MQSLKNKIKNEGLVLGEEILKVDEFLNHQLDTQLLIEMGKDFACYFGNKQKITKVLTVETSGIAIALTTGIALGVPVIFARKQKSLITDADVYSAEVYSFTKQTKNNITVAKKLLNQNDNILIIDDFLAYGEAALGLISIIKQSSANLVGIGIVIEKIFQGGGAKLRSQGLDVYALARIKKLIPPDQIEYV